MIIRFTELLEEYYTPEEKYREGELHNLISNLDAKTRKEHPVEFAKMSADYPYLGEGEEPEELPEWKAQFWEERTKLTSEYDNLHSEAKRRYWEDKGAKGVLEDVRRIVEAFTREDYLRHIKNVKTILDLERFNIHLNLSNKEKEILYEFLNERKTESYYNCYMFIWEYLEEVIKLLNGEPEKKDALEIIRARVGLWYTPDKPITPRGDEEPELPTLPKYDFVYPTNFQQNLTKASSTLFSSKNSLEELKQITIDVAPNKKGLTTTYSVNVDLSAPELKGTENITEYDKSVHNMAISMAKANKHGCFTAKQLATALMYGDNPKNSRPSPQQIGAVTKSIEKQRHIDITIDWTEHIKLNNKGNLPEEVSRYQKKGYMLPVEEHIFTVNGKTLHGYQFIKEPPLYQYASSVGQIGQHPIKMLSVPVNLDQTKIVIRDFLLEEIAHIKNNPKSWNNTISVDRLLDVAGEDSQTIEPTKKKRLIKVIKSMLEYWKTEGYIKGYKENKAKTTGSPLQSFTILTE